MAIKSNALTTRARLKTYLGISVTTYDTVLDYVIDATTDFVLHYCDRVFQQTAYSNQVYDGTGTKYLLLKNYPVVSGETFTLQERDSSINKSSFSTISSDDYFVKNDEGIVSHMTSIFTKVDQHYRITYTAGYDYDTSSKTLISVNLGDLEYAVWKLCAVMYYQRKSSGDISSERIGDYSVTYMKEVMTDPEVLAILNKYKRPYMH